MKEEKEIGASFAVIPETANVTTTASGKCSVMMEKILNFGVEDMNRTRALADGGVLPQRALSPMEDSSKGSPKRGTPFTSLLLQSIAIIVLVIISYC